MSAAAIRAGKAWVEMAIDDKTSPGLAAVQKKILGWGAGLAKVGGLIHGAGDAIIGTLSGAAAVFASAGSEIFDLSRATGLSAEELSGLAYAAQLSGASMDSVSAAMKGLAKFTGQVSGGSKQAAATLDKLGISSAAFLAASPYQRFLMIADALTKISDPGLRAALAMKTLGKGGMGLASLMADGAKGIQELVEQAQKLGLTITQEEADKADALGDAWDTVGKQFKQIAFVIGSAVAQTLTDITGPLQALLAGTISFIRANPMLIQGALMIGVALSAAGAGLLFAGGMAFVLAAALKVATVAMAAYGAITAFASAATAALFTPLGLTIAALAVVGVALVAAGGYWLYYSDVARGALQGIYDALIAGKWQTAGEIVIAALNVAWQAGIAGLKQMWIDFKYWLVDLFLQMADEITKLPGANLIPGVAGVQGGIAAARTGNERNLINDTLKNVTNVTDAIAALGKLTDEAAAAREKAFARGKIPALPDFDTAGGGPAEASFAAGTFNSAITGLLGSSGQNAHERTAKATEEALTKLDDIKAAVEELDLTAEE
jgi:hypothetical protein